MRRYVVYKGRNSRGEFVEATLIRKGSRLTTKNKAILNNKFRRKNIKIIRAKSARAAQLKFIPRNSIIRRY